ncbi:MAG TPA: hypothetical protein VLF67_01160 [Candidatus Saccharimonas sp.]|nr:hypothetical protein [Candidatus Saccharimonas sp.]
MNALLSLGSVRQKFGSKLAEVRQSRFFHDRISAGLLVLALVINGANLVWLILHVPAVPADIPVWYSSLHGFDGLGPWYSPFFIALFGLAVTGVNGTLSYQAFGRSRLASFYLLAGSVVVGVLCLVISNAFATVGL